MLIRPSSIAIFFFQLQQRQQVFFLLFFRLVDVASDCIINVKKKLFFATYTLKKVTPISENKKKLRLAATGRSTKMKITHRIILLNKQLIYLCASDKRIILGILSLSIDLLFVRSIIWLL